MWPFWHNCLATDGLEDFQEDYTNN